MNAIASTAVSGMQTAQRSLQAAAHDVASQGARGFRRQDMEARDLKALDRIDLASRPEFIQAPRPAVSVQADLDVQLRAKNAYLANLAVFRAFDRMTGSLLDRIA